SPARSGRRSAGPAARLADRTPPWPPGPPARRPGRLREAEGLARELGDPRRLGWVYAYLSPLAWHRGPGDHVLTTSEWTEAVALAERAATIADDVRDFRLQVAANMYLGTAAFAANDYR